MKRLKIDWLAVQTHYASSRSAEKTAAAFNLNLNTLKARIRREGWAGTKNTPRWLPPREITYVFDLEFRSCFDDSWVRKTRYCYTNTAKKSPYQIAGEIAATNMSVTETGVRVTHLGLQSEGSDVITPMNNFSLVLLRDQPVKGNQ